MQEIIAQVNEFFKNNIPKNRPADSYLKHVALVREYGLILAKKYKADEEVVEIAALLHDTGADAGLVHAQESAKIAEKLLDELKIDTSLKNRIISAISNHSSKKPGRLFREDVPLEDKIVRDADALSFFDDAFIAYYNKKAVKESHDTAKKITLEKLGKMLDKIKTQYGRELALQKFEKAKEFIQVL